MFKDVLEPDDVNRIMTQGLEKSPGITAVSPAGKLAVRWAGLKTE